MAKKKPPRGKEIVVLTMTFSNDESEWHLFSTREKAFEFLARWCATRKHSIEDETLLESFEFAMSIGRHDDAVHHYYEYHGRSGDQGFEVRSAPADFIDEEPFRNLKILEACAATKGERG